jgi:hypothetical protein
MSPLETLGFALGTSFASGLNLYATVAAAGLFQRFGVVTLPDPLAVLAHPVVLGVAITLFLVEFIADKIPYVDSAWDALHTFIRIPAGALLAAGATGDTLTPLTVVAGLLGGTITAGTHFTKAGGRALINTSPEPFSNWAASLTEDVAVLGGVWLAIVFPIAFLVLLVALLVLMVWLLPRIWRGVRQLWSALRPKPG